MATTTYARRRTDAVHERPSAMPAVDSEPVPNHERGEEFVVRNEPTSGDDHEFEGQSAAQFDGPRSQADATGAPRSDDDEPADAAAADDADEDDDDEDDDEDEDEDDEEDEDDAEEEVEQTDK